MKFNRVVGKIDKKVLEQAEELLTKVFIELARSPSQTNDSGSKLSGDPLIFTLVAPAIHVATTNIPTAATDGKKFYWNPYFLIKKGVLGTRMTCCHESVHALFTHPQRRGHRIAKLWNVAIDYIVNGMIMDDLFIRLNKSPEQVHSYFMKGFGNYLTIEQYVSFLQNPLAGLASVPGGDKFIAEEDEAIELPHPDSEKELTEEEKKELAKKEAKIVCYFADPNLPKELKSPERLYDHLLSFLPKCKECGSVGKYPLPSSGSGKGNSSKNNKENASDEAEGSEKHTCDENCNHKDGCGTCGDSFDILGFGDTVDTHIDATESQEEITKRISDAVKAAKQMAGTIPQGIEDELGKLTSPKIRWQDFIRFKLKKIEQGNMKNDWTKFRTRPMFAGLMVPKRTGAVAKFGCVLDTSGSMSQDDMSYGVSQLLSLQANIEGTILFCDCQPYFEQAKKIKSCIPSELQTIKPTGRGGTRLDQGINDFQDKLGTIDFMIVITDGYLNQFEIDNMKDPGCPVYWLITSDCDFNPAIGRVFKLRNY